MQSTNLSRNCVQFAPNFNIRHMNQELKKQVKMCLVDWLGVAIKGSVMSQANYIKSYTQLMVSIIGNKEPSSMYNAAMSNGYFGHILELDDVDRQSVTYPAAVVILDALSVGKWKEEGIRRLINMGGK